MKKYILKFSSNKIHRQIQEQYTRCNPTKWGWNGKSVRRHYYYLRGRDANSHKLSAQEKNSPNQ